ncbi:hypothetical protein BpHYR1_034777 [Brachionus plicatilis]|uniref:Uncharacterized protein n=1 Tax=Brachionus plicatilis TaxID=10195 RepID=A0A3M7S2A4_BRAPC|nr:hypothetical protein BpHYR1_034777 [Brachionus plicatilis]
MHDFEAGVAGRVVGGDGSGPKGGVGVEVRGFVGQAAEKNVGADSRPGVKGPLRQQFCLWLFAPLLVQRVGLAATVVLADQQALQVVQLVLVLGRLLLGGRLHDLLRRLLSVPVQAVSGRLGPETARVRRLAALCRVALRLVESGRVCRGFFVAFQIVFGRLWALHSRVQILA